MQRSSRVAPGAAILAAVLLRAAAVTGQIPPAWTGTWTLDVARSSPGTGPARYRRGTRRIEASESGVTIIDDLVQIRGGILHLEWTGKFDGLDYPVQGVEVVLTHAYRRVDDHTAALVQKIDGVVAATAQLAVSPDGRTLSITTSNARGNATSIYTKP
jgi:hypothetical protein